MALTGSFEIGSPEEIAVAEEFLANGYVIRDVEDRPALDQLRHEISDAAARAAHVPTPTEDGAFLDEIHRIVSLDQLNTFRLSLYRELNEKPWFRPTYFRLARRLLELLVGNELAMQNNINFSIQVPQDKSSLLDVHADVFSGETPYQVVQWLPLMDVEGTKSMFFLPRSKSEAVIARLADFTEGGMRALYAEIEGDIVWLKVSFGQVVVFSPNFLHGNIVNGHETTRWSLNCRFTGLFSPYDTAEKSLGSFYSPVTTRPVTHLGLAYRAPTGFRE